MTTSQTLGPETTTLKFSASPSDLVAEGKLLRQSVPRNLHGNWKAKTSGRDPIGILRAADQDRMQELVPIRYGRMLQSPFAFYRGSAAVMAADLVDTPASGLIVQACGDCHLKNFGGFATPERNIIFDINDFDETLPAPWEWDLKRLATSFVLAARTNGISEDNGRDSAATCARSYRKAVQHFSEQSPLEAWYARVSSVDFIKLLRDEKIRARVEERIARVTEKSGSDIDYPKLAEVVHGELRIRDTPPLIFHPEQARGANFRLIVDEILTKYRETLTDDRRLLFDRYRYVDAAIKVVGIGSVGTRCWIVLLMSPSNDPLFLQIKQANASVLEPYAGTSTYAHHGQRVVNGQRLMQAASDIFLGWTTGPAAEFYVRQLRDAKISPYVEAFDAPMLRIFAKACGWNLARAHVKTGNAWKMSGYLGNSAKFDDAITTFATAYADQAECDYAALKEAVRTGKIDAHTE